MIETLFIPNLSLNNEGNVENPPPYPIFINIIIMTITRRDIPVLTLNIAGIVNNTQVANINS
jgi:hypothetical protein